MSFFHNSYLPRQGPTSGGAPGMEPSAPDNSPQISYNLTVEGPERVNDFETAEV